MLEYYRFKVIFDLFQKGLVEEASFQLVELQRKYVSLCDENTGLKAQLQEYEDILYLQRNLQSDGQFYWLITGSIKQGPFCPVCYDDHGLLTRLSGEPFARRCTYCCSYFKDNAEMEPTRAFSEEDFDLEEEEKKPEFQSIAQAARGKGKVIPFARACAGRAHTG